MGRRKERRLAAMAASGRRVKLDLFLDPSPGEASLKEGIRGENRDQQTVVPTSSSSGCDCCAFGKKENPLALLGQYSDDEEEDEEAADQSTGETKGSPGDANAMVTHEHGDTACDKGNAHTEQSAAVGEQQDAPQTGDIKNCTNAAEENTVAPELALMTESMKATEDIHDASGMQIVGDLGGNWKAVMHEQSNQCYYWNTVTGETSWEMPNALFSGIVSDGVASASVPTTHMDYSFEPQAHAVPQNTLEVYPSDMSAVNGTSTYATFGMDSASAQYTQDAYAYTAAAASHADIDPLQLAKYGEDLLQKLNQLERFHGSGEGLELTRGEIGIRISDCTALSSYGSSLLPLWLHAEVHLKQLESSIPSLETSDEVHLKQLDSSISKLETSDEVHLKQLDSSISKLETSDVGPRCSKTEDKEPNEADGEDSKLEASAVVTAGDNIKN